MVDNDLFFRLGHVKSDSIAVFGGIEPCADNLDVVLVHIDIRADLRAHRNALLFGVGGFQLRNFIEDIGIRLHGNLNLL